MGSEQVPGKFPPGFIWGVATAAYQTEGAWNIDGKGESIWDRFCHENPSRIKDSSNGDKSLDSYHQYKEDVKLIKDMKAQMYRFSIAWARILPKGTTEVVNQAGIDYYHRLIDELIANGIQPCVTLFHWDLPQRLQEELGGWASLKLPQLFADYARICFANFGSKVKHWITINEPWVFTTKAYDIAVFAPGIKEPLETPYKVVHNMILAHGMAYRVYEKEFKSDQGGIVGISVDSSNYSPRDAENQEDVEAADRAFHFRIGWVLQPLMTGDYPPVMKSFIAKQSKLEGFPTSRLPEFDSAASQIVKNSFDYIGLNYYTSELVQPVEKVTKSETNSPGWDRDLQTDRVRDPSGRVCGVFWQRDVPTGLRKTLNWIKNQYGNPTVFITENGCSMEADDENDDERIEYLEGHIRELCNAVTIDGCHVRGYLAWSLLDVWEWSAGWTIGFGVHKVDRSSPDFKRTPKKSAKFLTKVFKENGLPTKG